MCLNLKSDVEMGITVVSLINDKKHVQNVKKLIEKISYNEFLNEKIGKPQVDQDLVSLYLLSLDETSLSYDDQTNIVAAMSFVQLALHIHERVAYPTLSLQERQLSVLAGDLYSGAYYHILAKDERIELITTFAHAIKLTNEYKIEFRSDQTSTIEDALELTKAAEKTVIEAFCQYFNLEQLISLFEEYVFLKKLEKELNMKRIGDTSLFYNKIQTLAENKFEEICIDEMNRSWEKLTYLINHHERISSAMKECMTHQLQQFKENNLSEKKG